MTHPCGACGRYTAVVNGQAMDFEADGFTSSDRPHKCGPNGRFHVVTAPASTPERQSPIPDPTANGGMVQRYEGDLR